MDNPLITPNKIQKLMRLAEDKSFIATNRLVNQDELHKIMASQAKARESNLESSSGILDLEEVEGFGDSDIVIGDINEMSLSKSTSFHPGEMSGRSTGAQDMPHGRHSSALDILTNQMDKQTDEVRDLMRHSICTDASFNSKRDLTADEVSLMKREGITPFLQLTQTVFVDSASRSTTNLSMGSYFKNRCPEFVNLLGKTDSPQRSTSMMPSITEVSASKSPVGANKNLMQQMDQSLDCVPVRQPRNNTDKIPERQTENIQNESIIHETEHHYLPMSTPKVPMHISTTLNPMSVPHHTTDKGRMNLSMRPDLMLKNLQLVKQTLEDTETSMENSLSISKIADYLGKQSNVSVTDMLKYNNKKAASKSNKYPLSELHLNMQEKKNNCQVQVTNLRDTRKTDTASSAGSVNTVLSLDKLKINSQDIPEVIISRYSLTKDDVHSEIEEKEKHRVRSKSPSSKSQSTLSTVQENFTSFKSSDSPLHSSKGEGNESQYSNNVPSPNIQYEELDKSVDWHDVLLQKRLKEERVAKEQWVEFTTSVTTGFVGVSFPVTINVTTLTDSWLTAKLQFDDLPNDGKDLTIELPRLPLLISPGKSEQVTVVLTSNIEMNTTLPFTMILKDSSIDSDVEQKGTIEINIKMPVIQAMSSDGVNKIIFPPIQEKTTIVKSFVLISDCPVDLLLDISVVEGESIFSIKNVQEIKKIDINKVLIERQGSTEDGQQKGKSKGNKQLCRLTSGNAIRVTISFNAPKLSDLQLTDSMATFNGILNVNLIGVSTVLKKVDLISVVGSVNLVVQVPSEKLHLSHEPTTITLCNTGSVPGIWIVKPKTNSPAESFPFKVSPSKFEIRPGGFKTLNLTYTGPDDVVTESRLIFEEITTNNKTTLEIIGGTDKPKAFPIKTNYNNLSWVRTGRKELSLKNYSNKRIHIRCQIIGEGFSIDVPGVESRGIYCLPFGPNECRPLPIIFVPPTGLPHAATLHLVYDKHSEFSRKIKLYGCASGDGLCWSGLVTYGDTALVRAVLRSPIALQLYNKSKMPAFVCARIQFNLQYSSVSEGGGVSGARRVIPGRVRHALGVRVQWSRVERAARAGAGAALATLSVIAGSEFTRRRILRIIKDESTGELDTSLLPDHLRVLADQFEGEDPNMDNLLADFNETKAMLHELIVGLQELTAQIDLPQDFSDENTIIISDDTIIEHHTLCD